MVLVLLAIYATKLEYETYGNVNDRRSIDLSDERASNDTDQYNPDSIRIQEWLEGCHYFMTQLMDPSTDSVNRWQANAWIQ